jgi:hypothetical protein
MFFVSVGIVMLTTPDFPRPVHTPTLPIETPSVPIQTPHDEEGAHADDLSDIVAPVVRAPAAAAWRRRRRHIATPHMAVDRAIVGPEPLPTPSTSSTILPLQHVHLSEVRVTRSASSSSDELEVEITTIDIDEQNSPPVQPQPSAIVYDVPLRIPVELFPTRPPRVVEARSPVRCSSTKTTTTSAHAGQPLTASFAHRASPFERFAENETFERRSMLLQEDFERVELVSTAHRIQALLTTVWPTFSP